MKTTIKHERSYNNHLVTKTAIIEYGRSSIVIKKYSHSVDTVTVALDLSIYMMRKYKAYPEKTLQAILEGLSVKELKRLLFDELDAQSVQPTTLAFKGLVYQVYTSKLTNKKGKQSNEKRHKN